MSAIVPFALALLAGVLSFSSPCCLPLMPGYVSYVSGVAGSNEASAVRSRVLGAALLFVLGFSIVFTALGAGASLFGPLLLRNRLVLTRVAGILVVLTGLVTIGLFRIPLLYREVRLDLRRIRPGPLGAAPLGMAFAVGWTPCIGPVLAGILTAAASTANAAWGAALLVTYSLGLGIPFLALAYACGRDGRLSGWLRRRGRLIELAGGAVLLLMGVLMITGQWVRLFIPLLRLYTRANWPPL
ncbi:Thiol:disulfide interchange protein DsbD [bacterium HR12]|nr:Thiol:disulfide interchange protein DsbD [bacterium HR12]GIU98399.1 MAG: putative cytochrome C biogenesis protein CcdA [Actinomycetota bacterium]